MEQKKTYYLQEFHLYDGETDITFNIVEVNTANKTITLEKLWQFSSHLVQKGLTILEVGNVKDQISVNLTKSDIHGAKMILKAIANGKPEYDTQLLDGRTRKVIKVNDKIYMI